MSNRDPNTVCETCGYPLTIGGCDFCNTAPIAATRDSAEDVEVSKALASPRFEAEFDRIFGRGGWK